MQQYLSKDNISATSCGVKEIQNRMILLIAENLVFILYQIFQFCLTIDAVSEL